jgi:peptide/nickel transport system substrate-binding protein
MKRLLLALLLLATASAGGAARAETTLRMVPVGDLRVLDPIWTSAAITLNHGQSIYDVLLTMDSKFHPQPQMAESIEHSPDGMRWTFRLRPGLTFHDGAPVTAEDVALSIQRWGKRVTAGQALMARTASLSATDARTVELVLSRPFGPVLEALATPVLAPFVMRAADARTDPFQQVKTTVGSGPFIFVTDEYQPGHRVVYRRNPAYVPRKEAPDMYAGGKVAKVDRVEWVYLPDQGMAVTALQTGEVDFLSTVPQDLQPLLLGRKDITMKVIDPSGSIGNIRPNSAHPPFSDPRARQALLLLVNQQEWASALAGNAAYAHACFAVFVCGSPYETDIATGPWKQPDFARAKKLLEESGYRGERLVLLDPADQPEIHMIALLTADALRRIGANVDLQTMDWSTVITRRNTREAPAVNPAGWDLAFTLWGGFSLSSPLNNTPLDMRCDGKNLYGWPCDKEMERLRAAFFDATDEAVKKKVIEDLQTRYYEEVPYVNTGMFSRPVAFRNTITGVLPTLYPVPWNIEKK